VKLSVIKHVHCKKKGEEVGLIATKEKGKFWHDLFESRSSDRSRFGFGFAWNITRGKER
jgi:hypothetical protein